MITEKKIVEILKDNSDVIDRSVNSESFRGVAREILSANSDSTAENKGQQKGMKWVKASETLDRLPLEKFMHVRDNTGCPRMGNFFKDEEDRICFSVIGTEMYETFIVPFEHLSSIEWLDESATDKPEELQEEVERLRDGWISVEDKMPEYYDALLDAKNDFEMTKKIIVITDRGNVTDNRRVKMVVGGKEWTWFMNYGDGDIITHWMEFKKPPNKPQIIK